MLVRVFFSTRYSVEDPRSDARSSPSSATLRPRYSVSSAATEPSRRPLMASTSATLLAFGTASPPQTKNGRSETVRLAHATRGGTVLVLRLRRRPCPEPGAFVPCGNRTVFGNRTTVAQGGCG